MDTPKKINQQGRLPILDHGRLAPLDYNISSNRFILSVTHRGEGETILSILFRGAYLL